MSSFHPFSNRPSFSKRHTSPSPALLLSLNTLEALPPTPRSAKSYEPLNIHFKNQNLDQIPNIGETSSSSSLNPRHSNLPNKDNKMPLIKPRSKRPTSPKSENYSFLPSIVSALDPRTNHHNTGRGGKHQRFTSRSNPPQPSNSNSTQRDFDIRNFSPFSSSTPPSTYSKGSLNALPSIQGVFDFYENSDGIKRNNTKKSKNKKDKRDTLKLPMMSPNERNQNYHNHSNNHPFNDKEKNDNWHWNGFNQPAEVIITKEDEGIIHQNPFHSSNSPFTSDYQNNSRKRNTSLTINTHLTRPSITRGHSSSSQSQNTSHYSLPAKSRSSTRSSPIDPQLIEERSTSTSWLEPEDEEEDLDDVELQALDVLETLSGHLLRDGFGYGTGLTSNTLTKEGVPSLTRSGNSTPSKCRSRSTTYSTQAPSLPETDKRYSGISDKDPPSIREWRENRKRTKSHGYALNRSQSGRPFSEQRQPTHTQTQNQTQIHTHIRGSMSISRRPPPPPPPPESSLPPLPTDIHSHTHMTSRVQTQTQLNPNTQANKNNKELYEVTDTRNGPSNLNHENNKHLISVISGSVPKSGFSSTSDQSQIMPSISSSQPPPPPPPIPPRSASRLESHTLNKDKSPRRASSSNQLRQRPSTPVQRKGSEENKGVKVPLVLSASLQSYSPATTTREEEGDSVVIIDNRPPTPAADMPSPTIPVHQRPLPPLPMLPDLSTLPIPNQTQRSALARLAHPGLPSRLLRPKRPSTAPALAKPALPMSTELPKPITRLVPRDEPRRLSSSSRMEGGENRKNGMSALSFLALDDAAIQNLSSRGTRATSTGGSSSISNTTNSLSHSGYGLDRVISPTQGLEGGYIMPPSERSKIGIDDRKEIRRRRKGSQSSLSSIAGSEITSLLDSNKILENGNEEVEIGEEEEEEEGGGWTTAYEFGQSKAKTKEREIRLSLDIGVRPTITHSTSLNSPPRSRPVPLNLFSFNDYPNIHEDEEKTYPKSAGLLPPPRPRRKTTPSAPPLIFSSQIQPTSNSTSPISPRNKKGINGQISPRYTRRSIGLNRDIGTTSNVYSDDLHRLSEFGRDDNELLPEDNDGFKDFMELNSPALPSPNLTTPGQSYVFPPSNNEHELEHDQEKEKERKVSSSTTKSNSISESNSSNWSNDTYEKERKMITSLWLSSKPTRSGTKQALNQNQNQNRNGSGNSNNEHPFYSIGKSGKTQFSLNNSNSNNGNGNGNGRSIVVDGGYGRRSSFGVKI